MTAKKTIDPLHYIPRYQQLSNLLLDLINNGHWQAHEAIPSERHLASEYKISRVTVREALNLLESQGFVYRVQGSGTFVSPPRLQQSINRLTSFTETMEERGSIAGQKILTFEYVEPSIQIAQKLEISADEVDVLFIERVRYSDNEPLGIQSSYVPIPKGTGINQTQLSESGSLFRLLEYLFGIIPYNAEECLQAIVADEKHAKLLEVEVGSALVRMEHTVWSQHRRPMEYAILLYRGDRYSYHWKTTRENRIAGQ